MLLLAENMVITIAKAQAGRGDTVPPNTAMALVITAERLGGRATELHDLAAAMLASFTKTDSGHSARVGQVQIAKWRKVLDGEP